MRKIIFQILFVLSIGLAANIVFGFFWGEVDLFAHLQHRSLYLIFSGFLGYILGMYLIETLRLHLLLEAYQIKLNFWEKFTNSIMGYFYSSITPMAAGGQPFQIMHLKSRGIQPSLASNIYVNRYVEHLIFSVLVILFSFTFTVNLLQKMRVNVGSEILSSALTLSIILSVLVSIILLRPTILAHLVRILGKFKKLKTWSERATDFFQNLQTSIIKSWDHHIGLMLFDSLLGILNTLIQALSLWITLLLIGIELDFLTTFITYMMLNLLVFYIPTPGASGGIEGVYSLAFGALSRDYSGAWSAVLLWRIGAYYLLIPVAFILLMVVKPVREFILGIQTQREHSSMDP